MQSILHRGTAFGDSVEELTTWPLGRYTIKNCGSAPEVVNRWAYSSQPMTLDGEFTLYALSIMTSMVISAGEVVIGVRVNGQDKGFFPSIGVNFGTVDLNGHAGIVRLKKPIPMHRNDRFQLFARANPQFAPELCDIDGIVWVADS